MISILFKSFLKFNSIFFDEVSLNELDISVNKSSNFIELIKLSSSICFFDIFFNISLHLFTWLISKSISVEISLLFPISFFNSFATTLMVANGVPKECPAAAACPPKDSSSYSFYITSCNLRKASDLFFVSPANRIPK